MHYVLKNVQVVYLQVNDIAGLEVNFKGKDFQSKI